MESDMPERPSDKKVSIIIPVYNREDTLPRLFSSLLTIPYRPLEIVLVDNGSQDQSLARCREFQKAHESKADRLNIVVGEEKQPGACAARNRGIVLSTGKYLYFFDSDDKISADFIGDLMPFFPRYDVVCAPTVMSFPDGNTRKRDCIPTAHPYDHILSASLSTQSFIIKKSFLEEIGNWDENIRRWNDWELGVRILCHQPQLKWLPNKAYHTIYQHPQSISGNSFSKDFSRLAASLQKAEMDILHSTLEKKTQDRSLNALSGKYILLAAQIYKEGNKALARKVYQIGRSKTHSRLFQTGALILYFLSKSRIPGIWRLFRYLV